MHTLSASGGSIIEISEPGLKPDTIFENIIPLPTSGRISFSPGPNGFDRLRDTFLPGGSEFHESTLPELRSESESSHDSTETVPGMALLRLSDQCTAPGVQHNYCDRGGCGQAGITPEETPSKIPAPKPRRGTTSSTASVRFQDKSQDAGWPPLVPSPLQLERGGGLRTAVEGIEFPSSPKRQRSTSATASSDVAANLLEKDKSHGERNLRQSPEGNRVHPVATPKQIHIATIPITTIPEDDDSVDKDSIAAQKARESATTPDVGWLGNFSHHQLTLAPETVTNTGACHGVGSVSQHTHNSVTSSLSPSAASGPRRSSPPVVRINAQLTPKSASQVSKCTADINVKKTTKKYKNRPGDNGMRWFTSFYRGNIVEPKIAEAPLGGDLYFHTNTISNFEQVWMYAGEGQGGWLDITEKYFGEDGTIIHPVEGDRVLSTQGKHRKPSFILKSSFENKKRKKERK
ncbi:hypothetical protein BD779DRAFT_1475329 [Infundibulicybe gibba]|nr:hypothetical protein BD779DRAFT_1475329 [Infundibulicybe gibba]